MKDTEDKLAALLMDYGVLKNADADKMARKIAGMFEKELDDALDKLKLSEAQVVQLLDENTRLKLDWSHSEAENAQLAAKCAEMRHAMECDDDDVDTWNHALSDDCGKGWLSPEKKERLRRKLICLKEVVCTEDSALVQEALDEIQ